MPQNEGKKAAKYKLTLVASGPTGSSKAKLTVLVGVPVAASIAAGGNDTCAVTTNGHIKCWGNNEWGQIGSGKTSGNQDVPTEVRGITDAKEVDVGSSTCALLTTGHVECWGLEEKGSLGNGVAEGPKDCGKGGGAACSTVPVEVQGISDAVQLGGSASCALLTTGHVLCWGNNFSGELGNGMGRSELEYSDVPVEVAGISTATQIAEQSQCALLSSGQVDCWGYNEFGELGDEWIGHGVPMSHSSDVPVEVLGITSAIQTRGTCAVLSSGHMSCWGDNRAGQLGDGTKTGPELCSPQQPCSTVPVEVAGLDDATQAATGAEHACALLTSTHVECWGENRNGQLGDGKQGHETGSLTPVEAVTITDAIQIAAGNAHTCALLLSGRIMCWGEGTYGQLGFGKIAKEQGFSTGSAMEVSGI